MDTLLGGHLSCMSTNNPKSGPSPNPWNPGHPAYTFGAKTINLIFLDCLKTNVSCQGRPGVVKAQPSFPCLIHNVGLDFSADGKYMALAERRNCKDCISIFACSVWQLVKVDTHLSVHIADHYSTVLFLLWVQQQQQLSLGKDSRTKNNSLL